MNHLIIEISCKLIFKQTIVSEGNLLSTTNNRRSRNDDYGQEGGGRVAKGHVPISGNYQNGSPFPLKYKIAGLPFYFFDRLLRLLWSTGALPKFKKSLRCLWETFILILLVYNASSLCTLFSLQFLKKLLQASSAFGFLEH